MGEEIFGHPRHLANSCGINSARRSLHGDSSDVTDVIIVRKRKVEIARSGTFPGRPLQALVDRHRNCR